MVLLWLVISGEFLQYQLWKCYIDWLVLAFVGHCWSLGEVLLLYTNCLIQVQLTALWIQWNYACAAVWNAYFGITFFSAMLSFVRSGNEIMTHMVSFSKIYWLLIVSVTYAEIFSVEQPYYWWYCRLCDHNAQNVLFKSALDVCKWFIREFCVC